MNSEIIASETIDREGNDCYIATTITLVKMNDWYVLLVVEDVSGWCACNDAQIKWMGSSKDAGLKQYNDFVREASR